MFALMLAVLVAQTTPNPVTTAPATLSPMSVPSGGPTYPGSTMPSETPAMQSSGTSAGGQPVTFPRGPRRLPNETPLMTAGAAIVRNSGSTNFAGYTIVIHPDDSVDVADANGGTTRATAGGAQVKWLFEKLKDAMPLTDITGGRCMKSASFGSTTTISYNGQTSPDLSCPSGPQLAEINRTIGIIVNQLGLTLHRSARGLRTHL